MANIGGRKENPDLAPWPEVPKDLRGLDWQGMEARALRGGEDRQIVGRFFAAVQQVARDRARGPYADYAEWINPAGVDDMVRDQMIQARAAIQKAAESYNRDQDDRQVRDDQRREEQATSLRNMASELTALKSELSEARAESGKANTTAKVAAGASVASVIVAVIAILITAL